MSHVRIDHLSGCVTTTRQNAIWLLHVSLYSRSALNIREECKEDALSLRARHVYQEAQDVDMILVEFDQQNNHAVCIH